MIVTANVHNYAQLKPFYQSPMLVLGNQESEVGNPADFFGVDVYETLDPDGGTYTDDLTGDLSHLDQKFQTVFNIGTIEHIWDAHRAWSNAAQLVKVGGYFLTVSPTEGWKDHAIHMTSYWAIIRFFEKNGFIRELAWLGNDEGVNGNQGLHITLWAAFRKVEHVTEFRVPQQLYENGRSFND